MTAAIGKDAAAVPPPIKIGSRAYISAPGALAIAITTPAVNAVAAAVIIPSKPDALESADLNNCRWKRARFGPNPPMSLRLSLSFEGAN
jgi:hypothetical protein